MLSEDQIDYLLQIKESKPAIPDGTVRVMLGALRWSPEEIERGIAFLNRPPSTETPRAVPEPEFIPEPSKLENKSLKNIVIKQNPFPVGSPFDKTIRKTNEKKYAGLIFAGFILGAVVFVVGLLIYERFAGF